jgi:hypothetical protein
MSQGSTTSAGQGSNRAAVENPVCCEDGDLPPPPAIGAIDPAEPHPAEPGAPDDAPTAVLPALERTD